MEPKIRIAILDDHQSIVDGYIFRFGQTPEIEFVASAAFGSDLEPLLDEHKIDVLLLDIQVPTSPENPNPYPILHLIPKILQRYPTLNILVISMHNQAALIKAVMEAGASGYILKDDQATIQQLGNVVRTVAKGGIHISQQAFKQLSKKLPKEPNLTSRQKEALSLCAAYPDATTAELANQLNVANSTMRNLLSQAYLYLDVHTRAAAIAKARQKGIIPEIFQPPDFTDKSSKV